MKNTFLGLSRFQKQVVAASTDIVCLPLIFSAVLLLHMDSANLALLDDYQWIIFASPLAAIPMFFHFGLYRAVIRYIDQKIIAAIIAGSTVATLLLLGASDRLVSPAMSVTPFLMFWVMCIMYMLTSRFAARRVLLPAQKRSRRVRVAIYGAGEGGNMLANAVAPGMEYEPVFFVDDSMERRNTTVRGLRVYPSSDLERLCRTHSIDTVLLAMPSITRQEQRKILDRLSSLSVKIKVTPQIGSVVSGKSRVEDVRQIEIEDILSRNVVMPNSKLLSSCITGKSVFVSGAGGSIGSELCRQILILKPARLLLLDISESALYVIEQELRELSDAEELDVELVPFIGSVMETAKCTRLMSAFQVETVYHAAAYKHVPLVEHNPIEGIRNNAFGTLSLAQAAESANVECFVLVSTDKAVRPTNVMGATKRLAELVLQAFSRRGSRTRFCMVRFGNVLGSSGSVVPKFRKQIAAGGPITLTHPDITRYFMTIPEAAQLVVQAGAMSRGGDVFVLDMGEPVRIADLAARMVHLSGQEVKSPSSPDGTIEITYVGLRPGEKLYEELLIGSNVSGTEHPLIQRAQEAEFEWSVLKEMLAQLEDACNRFDHTAIRAILQKLVVEYAPSSVISDNVFIQRATEPAQASNVAILPPVKTGIRVSIG